MSGGDAPIRRGYCLGAYPIGDPVGDRPAGQPQQPEGEEGFLDWFFGLFTPDDGPEPG